MEGSGCENGALILDRDEADDIKQILKLNQVE